MGLLRGQCVSREMEKIYGLTESKVMRGFSRQKDKGEGHVRALPYSKVEHCDCGHRRLERPSGQTLKSSCVLRG